MPKTHNVYLHDTKTNLFTLAEQVLASDGVILARNGQALVRLVPVEEGLRSLGLYATELSGAEANAAMRLLEPNEYALWTVDLTAQHMNLLFNSSYFVVRGRDDGVSVVG